MRYAVETLMGSTWENCWKEGDSETPSTFATREEAQAEIDSLIADVKQAVAAGDMSDEYDPEDYRIVEVPSPARKYHRHTPTNPATILTQNKDALDDK